MENQTSLAGQIALITGGSRGIGLAVARRLGSMGAKVAICARDRRRLEESAAILRDEGVAVLPVPADVGKGEDVTRLVAQVESSLGPLDIVVNNAGVGVFGPGQSATEEDWDRVLDTNLKGVFLVCRAVAGGMIERRRGHIINISSPAKMPSPTAPCIAPPNGACKGSAFASRRTSARTAFASAWSVLDRCTLILARTPAKTYRSCSSRPMWPTLWPCWLLRSRKAL